MKLLFTLVMLIIIIYDVSGYQSGIYNYFVEYGGKKSASKKLVIR